MPRLSSVTKAPGDEVTFEISAKSQPARAPVALKWEVIFPAQLMDLENSTAGRAATDSGKSLQCTPRKSYAYVCSLSGGQNPIGDGLIAIYHFKVKATAKATTTALRIEKAEATTKDSKMWPLDNTEASVIIR